MRSARNLNGNLIHDSYNGTLRSCFNRPTVQGTITIVPSLRQVDHSGMIQQGSQRQFHRIRGSFSNL